MTEGVTLNLVLNGATLLAALGVAVRLWLASRSQKIGPQPFEVRQSPEFTPAKVCDERHSTIFANTENLFCRMVAAEQRISKIEATVAKIEEQYRSIDASLVEVLRRLP